MERSPSPNGLSWATNSRVAAVAAPNGKQVTVWTARPNGTDPHLVGKGNITALTWSHDGKLAWLGEPQTSGVPWFIIIRSGSTTRRVNLPFASARSLAWSPDGTRFAIVAQAKGAATFDVYTLTTEGKDIRRITRNVDAFDVAWRS